MQQKKEDKMHESFSIFYFYFQHVSSKLSYRFRLDNPHHLTLYVVSTTSKHTI